MANQSAISANCVTNMRAGHPSAWLSVGVLSLLSIDAAGAVAPFDSCDDLLPESRHIGEALVGPQSCLMQKADVSFDGREFVRIDMGLNGTAEGYVTKEGPYHEYLTNGPDLVFEQAATPGERLLAIAHYERLRGAAILLIYPENESDWNGKLWVTAHGRGRSFRNGSLEIWNRYYDPVQPMAAFDEIHRVMLSRGYALAVTKRTSVEGAGEVIATLEDGTVVDWAAFNDNSAIIKDFSRIAAAALEQAFGKEPSRIYLYGHSAGARIARSLNYTPGLNVGPDGDPAFDGFLLDDSATGLWLPVVMENGRDVLFDSEEERQAFSPQIEIVHQLYTKVWSRAPDRPRWVSNSYLTNKRMNAKILMDKGLGSRFRMYEVRSMSHNGGERLPVDGQPEEIHVIDVASIIGGAIDMLDALVEGGDEPPPSKSDWSYIGDADRDGVIEHPAIAYPEVACPLGVFYPWPQNGSGTTAFAEFTGEGVEPLDGQKVFVDMNRNGVWDFRETPTAAWRRLGLLDANEELTRERYVRCVRDAAGKLERDGFFDDATVDRYVAEAQRRDLLLPAGDE